MTDRWVVNASPLILLGKAGQLDWVARLGEVVVPQSVAAEINAGPDEDPARQWIENGVGGDLIRTDAASHVLLAWDLGAGETSVIAWAVQHPEAVLDDGAARACARVSGISFRGTLSLVAPAKRRGFIPAVRPVFDRLQAAGVFALIEQVARAAGE